jgi:hypothetical protein
VQFFFQCAIGNIVFIDPSLTTWQVQQGRIIVMQSNPSTECEESSLSILCSSWTKGHKVDANLQMSS